MPPTPSDAPDRSAAASPGPSGAPGPAPRVSVVVPAHDAAATIDACLASVFASRGVSFEVIVADDGSRDDTRRRALEHPCRVVAIEDGIWAANARNLAARHAKGGILVFFDADMTMPDDLLARYAAALDAEPEVDAVVGSYTADTPAPGFFSKLKNFTHHRTHQRANPEGITLHSGLMAIRRDVFEALGGFEPAFAPASIEDIALGYRMTDRSHRIRFRPDLQATHWKRYTLASLLRSDVLDRAIPWTCLMLRERKARSDLNTGHGEVVSVALSGAIALALIGLRPGVALGLVVVQWALNAGLLGDCRRQFGTAFLLKTMAFLPILYFAHGVGLVLGLVAHWRGRSAADPDRRAPEPRYRVLEPQTEPAAPTAR